MTGYYVRPVSPWGSFSLFLARLSFLVLVIAGLAHRYAIIDTIGFFWVLGFICLAAMAALVLAVLTLQRLWERGDKGGKAAMQALVLTLLVLSPFAVSAYRAVRYPVLHDISTDTELVPSYFLAAGLRTASQNRVTVPMSLELEAQSQAYPLATGRRYDSGPDRVVTAVTNVVAANNWRVISRTGVPQESPEIAIEARAFSLIFAFPADVVIRITDEGETTYVDMRSSSLYGKHDMGDNARRITAFMAELDAEMVALAGT